MKVVFATLFLGDKPTEPFRRSLENCLPAIEEAGWEHELVFEANCPYISAARATTLKKAYDQNPDCVVFLDYDVSWTPESMVRLLEAEGDVVCGTYRKKTYNLEYMGSLVRGANGGLITRPDGALQAEHVPAGFLKISRKAIDTFSLMYPELLFGCPMNPSLDMFNHGVIDKVWYGEDYAFSKRWNDKCGTIWLLPDLDIHHHKGNQVFEGNFHQYLMSYNKPKPILSDPLVSIVIPAYNYARYLGEAIESALNQTYWNIEVIVVDDGSTDDTRTVAWSYPSVKYIYQSNKGSASARNTGISHAKGEWIVCLDADDILKPAYIEKCLNVAEADIISTDIQFFGDKHKIVPCKDKAVYFDFVSHNRIHCASMFRKKCWEDVGGYDTQLHSVYDDWEFWLALTRRGYEVRVIPEALFKYRKHGASMIDQAVARHDELYKYICDKYKIEKGHQ